jgi:hypothetical protein
MKKGKAWSKEINKRKRLKKNTGLSYIWKPITKASIIMTSLNSLYISL